MVFPDVPSLRGWSEVDYVAVDLSRTGEPEPDEDEDEAQAEIEQALAEDNEDDYIVPGDLIERT